MNKDRNDKLLDIGITKTKINIPAVRRIVPNTIAEDIVGVQPMTGRTSGVFTLKTLLRSPWTEWEKIFVLLPKRSINDKLIVGLINKSECYIYDHAGSIAEKELTEYRWATDKELFILNLKGEHE